MKVLQAYLNICESFRAHDPIMLNMGMINDYSNLVNEDLRSWQDRLRKYIGLRKAAELAILEERKPEVRAVLCDLYLKAKFNKDPDSYESEYQRRRAHEVTIKIIEYRYK